jgi:hypothetical protein
MLKRLRFWDILLKASAKDSVNYEKLSIGK